MTGLGSMKQLQQSRNQHKWIGGTPKAGCWAECANGCGVRQYCQHNKIKVFCLPGSDVKLNHRPPCKPKPNA